MTDEITLTLPRRRSFYRVAHLVLGGLAVRLDLTFEHLEDIQLALAGLLDRPDEDGEIQVRVRVEDEVIRTVVGPFDRDRLDAELDRAGAEAMTLRRLLETVMDRVEIGERDGVSWVELTKTAAAVRS
jgi:anti-sigma regulatory factor (Ser/Thr protein kinase)